MLVFEEKEESFFFSREIMRVFDFERSERKKERKKGRKKGRKKERERERETQIMCLFRV